MKYRHSVLSFWLFAACLLLVTLTNAQEEDRVLLRYDKTYMLGRSDSDFVVVERNLRGRDEEDEIVLNVSITI